MSNDVTQDPRFATLPERLGAQLSAVEAIGARLNTEDITKLEHARRNLKSTVEQAQALKVQYEAVQNRFGPLLERMTQLEMDQLRTVRGYERLGDIAENSKRALADLRSAITQLEGVPAAVERLTVEDLFEGGIQRIPQTVANLKSGPARLVDKCDELMKRLASFEVAQKS